MEPIKKLIKFSANVVVLLPFLLSIWVLPGNAETFYQKKKNGTIHITNIPPREKGYQRIKIPWQTIGVSRRRSPGSFKYSGNFDHHINEKASYSGIDPRLIKAIIKVESNFNPRAISPKGAMGLMQLMPETAKRNGVRDPYDPVQNISGGVRYFKKLTKMFKGDLRLALAGYNAGEQAVKDYGYRIPPYQETIDYVEKVLAHYNYLKNGKGGKVERKPIIKDVSSLEGGSSSSMGKDAKMEDLNHTGGQKTSQLSTPEGLGLAHDAPGSTING